MISWLLTNLLISSLALVFIYTNSTSPHRLRFQVGFAALCCWLVPWQKLAITLPAAPFGAIHPVRSGLGDALPLAGSEYHFEIPYGAANVGFSLDQAVLSIVMIAALPGLLLFLANAWRQHRTLRQLERSACRGDHLWGSLDHAVRRVPILIQDRIPGAFTSGTLTPKIWVHESLADSPALDAVLLHEHTHIRHRDNGFLVIIALVELLLWWNPATRLLAARTRALQELSCDEYCTRQLPDYRERLASLILGNLYREPNSGSMALMANMFTKKNADVERIRLMERRYTMKARHIVSTAGVMAAAAFSIVLFAQDNGGQNDQNVAILEQGNTGIYEDARLTVHLNRAPLVQALYPLTERGQTGQTLEEMGVIISNENLIVIQDDLAYDIHISVQAQNKTVTEIIDLMSVESGCNIYIDRDKIVVDACGI